MPKTCVMILFTMLVLNKAYSQKQISLREKFVNALLSDTSMGLGYYIPLKIKFTGNDTVYMWCDGTQFLFQYYNEHYKWDGNTFIKKIKPYILNEKAWEVKRADVKYFLESVVNPLTEKKCNCVFNESDSGLLKLPKEKKIPKGNSGEFACLVYNCFKKNLAVVIGEDARISISPFEVPPIKYNELDGSRVDGKKSVEKR